MDEKNCTHPYIMKKAYLFLLWLIKKKEMHGYEIMKTLKADGMHAMGSSTLYPLLGYMLSEGMISQIEKKTGKRVRKVYVVTAKGRKTLKEGKSMFKGLIGRFVKEMVS